MRDIKIKYYQARFRKFKEIIQHFCDDNNIEECFNEAIYYNNKTGVGPFFYKLFKAPKMYLANSRTFLRYRRTLDKDFQNEIITDDEIKYFQSEILKNKKLQQEVKKIMKNDFIKMKGGKNVAD